MAPLRQGVRIGPYVVEEVLPEGKGGFAQVVVARRRSKNALRERVALKIAKTRVRTRDKSKVAQMVDAYARSLSNEVDTLRQLRHPGIVRLFPMRLDGRRVSYMARAMEIDDQPWYFVIEYLAGGPVASLVKERGSLDMPLAVEITQQVCTVLDYVHSKGFAHLDIKGSNMLFRHPPDGKTPPEVVLVDFGAAQKAVRRAEVEAGALVYLPPERVRVMIGDSPPESFTDKAAADIYSTGIAFYHMLAGRVPFRGRHSHVTTAILHHSPTRPSVYNPSIKRFPEVDALILGMLDKQPAKRPRAQEVVGRLEQLVPAPRFGLNLELPRLRKKSTGSWKLVTFALLAVTVIQAGGLFRLWLDTKDERPEMVVVTATSTPTVEQTSTPLPPTPTPTPTPRRDTATPTRVRPTRTPSITPKPTATPTKSISATPVPTFTPTPTPNPTATHTPTPTATSD